ncbi:MAG TPA: UDP-N-acetylmuramoyl-L-alanyl-D-glutamate--2,6-diaminopimelate ligase [Mycobacteriales bacterium]|nr:UDP-N-acetylmuramoyl-L-alanyl-D-glutamate--2,6-diaminopimelate ligase [Mycobacteriales bacterium]
MSDAPIRPGVVTPRRLDALPDRLGAARLDGDPTTTVTGITHDSREVLPGDLYVARAGATTHGIDHVEQAVAAGAVAVLTDPPSAARARAAGARAVLVVDSPREVMGAAASWVYGDPSRSLLVLGITGTNGKTTTAYLLESGLRAAGRRTGLLGTIETRIDGVTLPSARTTPEATDLQALFAVMVERGVDAVAMEVSSHALALNRIDGTVVDVAGFTNLSQDHLDFHVDMEDYFGAKARLFTPSLSAQGVVCIDDEWGIRLAATAEIPVTTTGAADDAQWRRCGEQIGPRGGRARLVGPEHTELDVRTALTGRVNLSNAALAVLVLVRAGLEVSSVLAGVASLAAVPGRMERVEAGQPFLAVVDYAHTPDAVARLLADARRLVPGRVIAVLGCGGDRDRAKRPLMGAAVTTGADIAVLTNDNPRSEDPAAIVAEMLVGVPPGVTPIVELDRRAAIGLAVAQASADDAVVVAGKGHERGQEIGGQVLPFDDRAVLREALMQSVGAA